MNKLNTQCSKEEIQILKKGSNILNHKGNADENCLDIPSHSSQNCCQEENRQQTARMQGKRVLATASKVSL